MFKRPLLLPAASLCFGIISSLYMKLSFAASIFVSVLFLCVLYFGMKFSKKNEKAPNMRKAQNISEHQNTYRTENSCNNQSVFKTQNISGINNQSVFKTPNICKTQNLKNKRKTLKKRIIIFAAAAAFVLGVCLCEAKTIEYGSINFENKQKITVDGKVDKITENGNYINIYLKDVRVEDKNRFLEIIVILNNDFDISQIKPGNKLMVRGTTYKLSKARNYGNFDEERYYHSIGVSFKLKASDIKIINSRYNAAKKLIYDFKQKLMQSFSNAADEEKAGFFIAITAGERSGLTDEMKTLYQDSGIAHILAVSGLHISLIGMFVYKILKKLFGLKAASAVSAILMAGFCIMCGAAPSAVRATIMFFAGLSARLLGKKYDILSALALAACLILIANPYYIDHTGFRLSFTCILAIGVPGMLAGKFIKTKSTLAESFVISASITLFSLPLMLSAFYKIPVYSVLLNLIVIPLMSFILGSAVVSGILGLFFSFAGRFVLGIGIYLTDFVEICCKLSLLFPNSIYAAGNPNIVKTIVFYILFLALVFALCRICKSLKKTGWYLGGYFKKAEKLLKHKLFRALVLIFAALAILLVFFLQPSKEVLEISFIDVDQGDCILIDNRKGDTYLIDGGSSSVKNVGSQRIKSALLYKGISEINYLIVTHPDEDHISGIKELMEEEAAGSIKIDNVLIPVIEEHESCISFVQFVKEKGINIINLHSGMMIEDGDLKLSCVSPDKDGSYSDINDASAVIDLEYGKFDALFTGDISEKTEKTMIKNKAFGNKCEYELLKTAHHGSRGSTSKEFLDEVSFETAVISAGVNNTYGHPHEETLKRLEEAGTEILVTAECGEIDITAHRNGSYTKKAKLQSLQ